MNLTFAPILSLKVWHDYYLEPSQADMEEGLTAPYDISQVLTFIPTSECQKNLQKLRWLMRPQPDGFVLLSQIDAAETTNTASNELKPKVPIDFNIPLTFWLVVRDSNFANYTNLPIGDHDYHRDYIYYFSNRSDNQEGDRLFLSQPLIPYKAGAAYPIGHLVTYTQKQQRMTLEAVRPQSKASRKPNLIEQAELDGVKNRSDSRRRPGDWSQLPNHQYVSTQDLLSRQKLFYSHTITTAKPGDRFQFSLINSSGQSTWTFNAQAPETHPPETALTVNLNFSCQPSGYYQLLLNENLVDAFALLDPMKSRDAFALVEIILNPTVLTAPFRLLDQVKNTLWLYPKTYNIHFKNRATYWRYCYKRPHGFANEDLPATFQPVDEFTYVTRYPIGLRQRPERLLKDGNHVPLPPPQSFMIQPQTEKTDVGKTAVTAVFSDIYL